MAEKKTNIKQKWFENGCFIELNCCICNREETLAAATKKELSVKIKENGWSDLESDLYGVMGYYCGCDYKD